ncbi:MAG: undecaprenyldiphospho-muramoylpentapeptide beta-N-acetylglucosaminyltransferase [Gammaproteobacteria bacterium]|jgi:UDP-N-acetylglucosamine--N-acetylmuramyl-(pentapeptide) pyrophosphoryl-undecaprenol N-acetylglucosamine transferase|nr:undecaprenyldiphospho-muramoylpentapeptide beta-N-acetylglucosaminyltransferase [Gammaproteobacteria bacterium]
MILAGGTGGHVYPALAVARKLLAMEVPVVWMGTHQGLEAEVVPRAGIPIDWLSIGGLRGKGVWTWFAAPFRLNVAIMQAFGIMLRRRPRAVLGMGGFVAGPGGVVAFLLQRYLVIHEQNAVAGLTNRLLRPLCDRVFEGFPGAFGKAKATHVGNPVRDDIAAIAHPAGRIGERTGQTRLLVLGGSLGARALNEVTPRALELLDPASLPEVIHQAGRRNIDQAVRTYERCGVRAGVRPYIEDMAEAYRWADLVLCRAGALTIAELAAAGVGSILVPYPSAVDDHQSANAAYLEAAGAGIVVQQRDLDEGRLASILRKLCGDRGRLCDMACAARELARPEAADLVANACLRDRGAGAETI